jgi:Tol biopolymer transport system component
MIAPLCAAWLWSSALTTADDPPAGTHTFPERFLVRHKGYALLGANGDEAEHLESISNGAGAISPNGKWIVFSKFDLHQPKGQEHGELVLQSRIRPSDRHIVPLIWGTTGSSLQPLWSSDSRRVLICEQGFKKDNTRASAYRIYDLEAKTLTALTLPKEWWPSDWSADGKRLLTSVREGDGGVRIAWVSTIGTGMPEFLTTEGEVGFGAKLSPDNRRVLCMLGPRKQDNERYIRLHVIDLATGKRSVIDKPGHTFGYCWASDGSGVAYTWQMPLRDPGQNKERKTYLITCDPDGRNQRTLTMRKTEIQPNSSGKDSVVYFFEVLAWWK